MNSTHILQILGDLEEFNATYSYNHSEKIMVFQIDPQNYGLLTYNIGRSRISFIKLNLKELVKWDVEDNFALNFHHSGANEEHLKICLLNVFCIPFTLFAVVCTNKNVWAIGKEAVVNLKPYIEFALENAKSYENDDNMDVDDIEEFHHDMFDIVVKVHHLEKYDFHLDDIFVGCNTMDYGIIRYHKMPELCTWELEFLLFKEKIKRSSDIMAHSFLDFPILFNKSSINIISDQGPKDTVRPIVIFIHHSDSESHMFRNLFGIHCTPPNVICLIGHPDGKLLWSLCDSSNQFHSSLKLQTLFDVKQSIVGIYFMDNNGQFEDCDCMLVVGTLGQITLFSSKKLPSFTVESREHPFWTMTVHLKSSITNCIAVKDCLLHYSSDRTLWITNLSAVLNANQKAEELCLASNSSEFCCIEQMVVVNRNQGLVLLQTSSGNVYLTQCRKEIDSDTVTSSLPSLMNDCLKQSNNMQELLSKKMLQSRLFAVISTLASLKFCENTLKGDITFTISEVNLEPRKYMLVINFKCFEKLCLDSELCHVTATVFTYFKSNYSLVTKTAPYIADESTLCLELTDTVLQPPFISIFPLFVEVGLILQLPDTWKNIDCFKIVSEYLPFYLRVQTFMVHELHLLQSNTLCFPQSLKCKIPKTMQIIKELGMKRPISSILQVESKKDYQLPMKFNICLSTSSVEEMMRNFGDTDPCKFIEKHLYGNMQDDSSVQKSLLTSKNSPFTVNVTKNNSHIVITLSANSFESLIGFRIAVMDILLAAYNKSKHLTNSSAYVTIPASIYRKCEMISKSLISLYGKDVESDEVTHALLKLYQELRTEVSEKLPIL